MTLDEFDTLTTRLAGEVRFLYFHLMGEPFLHPLLPEFILMARRKGFTPVITTNGTLLAQRGDLLDALPHKLQISLHSHEGNGKDNPEQYIDEVMSFAKEAAQRGCIVVLRLWNEGGLNRMNGSILDMIAECQPRPWTQRHDGWKLTENLYVESDDMFEWPDLQHDVYKEEEVFCYALRNQIGVLADGTVVPCCLDHNGDMPLGNLYDNSLNEILASPRATALYQGSPATPPWNPYAGAADIPPFPNGSENRNRNGRQEVVSFQFRFGNHDEGTSLKFLILGLAMSISFRYHWSLPLRSPSI